MLAAGVYDLGLTAAEFFSFTPRHIDAFHKRHLAAEERQDRRVASLMAFYAEAHRDRDKRFEPFTLDDFLAPRQRVVHMPNGHPGETPEEIMARMMGPRLSPEEQVSRLKAASRGFGKWTVENG